MGLGSIFPPGTPVGGSSNYPGQALSVTKNVSVAIPQIVRPNNTTGYTNGGIWGPAVDARWSFVVPAMPAGSRSSLFSGWTFRAFWKTSAAQVAVSFNVILFTQQPTSIIGDRALPAFTDAEIATIPVGAISPGSNTFNFPAASVGGQNAINASTFRHGINASANPSLPAQAQMPPGSTVYGYLQAGGAYTPIALETMDLIVDFTYTFASGAL
jgi:hypothetical protein